MNTMRILVVDDSKVARAVLKKVLKELGYTDIVEAEDGLTALQTLQRAAFDLVISDWNMPNLDGLDLVQALHSSPLRDIPVLMVSSESYLNRIVDVMRAGAQGYIRKPFTAEALRAKIVEVMKKRELAESRSSAASLSGRLDEIGFPELVQFLAVSRLSGRLVLHGADRVGSVDLRDGEVHAAECGDRSGDDAAFEIATFEQGAFRFEPADYAVRRNVTMATMALLIEAMRRRDEQRCTTG
jgi:two-component system chemotaxis response regulator CheY